MTATRDAESSAREAAEKWLARKRMKTVEGTVWVEGRDNDRRNVGFLIDDRSLKEADSLAALILSREQDAYRRGEESMRERAAVKAENFVFIGKDAAAAIRSLPAGEDA